MLKSKILISLLTGSISLISLGTISVVSNPEGASRWISQNIIGGIAQNSAESGKLGAFSNWIGSTVPLEKSDEVSDDAETTANGEDGSGQSGSGAVDAIAAATTERIESVTNSNATGSVDAVASPSVESSATSSLSGTGYSSTSPDAIASASTKLSSGTTQNSTGTSGSSGSTVDAMASASQKPSGSTTTISEAKLKSIEDVISIALKQVPNSTYKGYELEDEYPPVYKIFLVAGSTSYEVEIHAVTGAVLEIDSESIESGESSDEHENETIEAAEPEESDDHESGDEVSESEHESGDEVEHDD